MAFNGLGTYVLPIGNPVVTGSTISTLWANSTLSDIATALTNAGVWQVFAYPPPTPLPFSVIISPGDPYVTPSNNSYNTIVKVSIFFIFSYQYRIVFCCNWLSVGDLPDKRQLS
jgi:hypothetical protein